MYQHLLIIPYIFAFVIKMPSVRWQKELFEMLFFVGLLKGRTLNRMKNEEYYFMVYSRSNEIVWSK